MPEYLKHLNLMLAAWNEPEPTRIRPLLDQALAISIRFVDPSIDLTGIDAFEANIHETHSRLPRAVYSRTSQVDSQHGFHRYHWAIHQKAELIMPGFDVAETDDSGRVVSVIGFFGLLENL
jgi:hypothetical protein